MIHVFFAEIPDCKDDCGNFEPLPPEWEKYVCGIKDESRRRQSLYSRRLLGLALQALRIKAEEFVSDESGRWKIKNPPTEVDFSLSHSKNAVAVAVLTNARGEKVGVDTELVSERILKLGARIAGVEETRLSAEELTRIWTKKESAYKAGTDIKSAFFATKTREVCGEKYVVTVACASKKEIEKTKFYRINDYKCIPYI